ncbi:MAG: hypothetical protein AAFQ82_18555, partial [Myxococcota bacterium]
QRSDPLLAPLRAFHASEIGIVFGTFDRIGYNPPDGELDLSAQLRSMWTHFARFGEPGLSLWEPYGVVEPVLSMDADDDSAILVREDGFDTICEFWEPWVPNE